MRKIEWENDIRFVKSLDERENTLLVARIQKRKGIRKGKRVEVESQRFQLDEKFFEVRKHFVLGIVFEDEVGDVEGHLIVLDDFVDPRKNLKFLIQLAMMGENVEEERVERLLERRVFEVRR